MVDMICYLRARYASRTFRGDFGNKLLPYIPGFLTQIFIHNSTISQIMPDASVSVTEVFY